MAHKGSKRQRKQKNLNSLRSKARGPASAYHSGGDNPQDRLAVEDGATADTVETNTDSNALLLPAKPKHKVERAAEQAEAGKASKSEQRRARKAAEAAQQRAARAGVLAQLQAHALSQEQHRLLLPAASRGQRETKRQRLRRALLAQRLGLEPEADSRLEQACGAAGDEEVADSSDDDSDEDMAPAPLPPVKQSVAQQRSARPASAGSEASSEADGSVPMVKRQKIADAAVESANQRQVLEAVRKELGLDTDGGALPKEVQLLRPSGPTRVVSVVRAAEVEAAREGLPITGMEQEVMEALAENDIVLLCGETGCGKTTQVPQFLYEAGYGCKDFPERSGLIGVTQPRRVAAVSTAARVAHELGTSVGGSVGYQVRYNRRVGGGTAIKFMTDGILMRELQDDFLLRRYSAIIIDEAHERSLNTDLLLGLLSRIVPLRRRLAAAGSAMPLKLLIMSATLRVEDFTANAALFPIPPPVISVPARQYPVTLHFARRTELHDYAAAAYKKVCQIHRGLPPGGILVFLTGQREVDHLVRKLRAAFAPRKPRTSAAAAAGPVATHPSQRSTDGAAPDQVQASSEKQAADADGRDQNGAGPAADEGGEAELDSFGADAAEQGGLLADDASEGWDGEVVSEDELMESGDEEEEVQVLGGEGFTPEQLAEAERHFEEKFGIGLGPSTQRSAAGTEEDEEAGPGPVHVLPLYAMLPATAQARVFQPPPAGSRLIVVATNVAETSLTIPGIRYVVDAGRSKQRLLEAQAGLARFEVRWVSKASAAQRAGRAGRTGPGHCYRLYSSAHYNDTFPQHSPPEILNTALEGVVLAMKALGVDRVANFPFPTPPERPALAAAQRCLVALAALDAETEALTPLGCAMARFPLSPRHARMLLQAAMEDERAGSTAAVVPYALALAASMSVESPFLHIDAIKPDTEGTTGRHEEAGAKQARSRQQAAARAAHASFRHATGDALSAARVLWAYEAAGPAADKFCREHFMVARPLREAAALHQQLRRIVATAIAGAAPAAGAMAGLEALRRGAQADELLAAPSALVVERLQRAIAAGWADQVSRRVRSAEYIKAMHGQEGKAGRAVRYQAAAVEEEVYLHPRSSLHTTAPQFVVYTELVRTTKRPYMAGVTSLQPHWLAEVAAPLCTFSPPLTDPPPAYRAELDAVVCYRRTTFSRHDWELPLHAVPHPDATDAAVAFAAALLEGRVVPALAALAPQLAVPAKTAALLEARAQPRVGDLLAALTARKVASRASLAAAWKEEPAFLRRELAAWLRKGCQQLLEQAWPRLLAESLQEAAPMRAGKNLKKRKAT